MEVSQEDTQSVLLNGSGESVMEAPPDTGNSGSDMIVDIPHFPSTLTFITNIKQEIPKHLYEKLKLYYIGITNLLHLANQRSVESTLPTPTNEETNLPSKLIKPTPTVPPSTLMLIHQYCRLFKGLIYSEQVLFPTSFIKQFCVFCDCIQIVGLTTTMRLKRRTKYSKINTKLNSKMKSEMVFKCVRCEKITKRIPAFCRGDGSGEVSRKRNAKKVEESNPPTTVVSSSSSVTTLNNSKDSKGTGSINSVSTTAKKGFSFLQTVSGLKGPHIAGRGITTAKPPQSFTKPPPTTPGSNNKKGNNNTLSSGGLDFIAFSPPTSNTSLLNKRDASQLTTSNDQSPTVNLIEIERMNKKKRRKSKESSDL
eukprot:gene7840-8477_t